MFNSTYDFFELLLLYAASTSCLQVQVDGKKGAFINKVKEMNYTDPDIPIFYTYYYDRIPNADRICLDTIDFVYMIQRVYLFLKNAADEHYHIMAYIQDKGLGQKTILRGDPTELLSEIQSYKQRKPCSQSFTRNLDTKVCDTLKKKLGDDEIANSAAWYLHCQLGGSDIVLSNDIINMICALVKNFESAIQTDSVIKSLTSSPYYMDSLKQKSTAQ